MISSLLIETGLILGILVISILFFFQKKNKNYNNYFLILTLFSALFSLFVNHLNVTRKIIEFPYLIRTGNITAYLIFPFLYIYTRNSFYPGRFWQKKDYLLLVPAIFYVVDMLPFYFSSPDFKIDIMRANLDHPERMFKVAEGWISIKGFHFIFRYLWSVLIMVFLVRLIYRNRHIDLKSNNSINRPLFWFIITLNALHLPLIIPGIFGAIFHLRWFSLNYMNMSLALVMVATTIFILFSPLVLYGFLPQISLPPQKHTDNDPDLSIEPELLLPVSSELSKLRIPETEMNAMIEKIEGFMKSNNPFIDQHYSIHDLSRDINIPVYQLSPVINNYYHTNFNSWLNKFRVEYFIQISQLAGKKDLTLDAISKEAGFTNRTTFTNAFKKEKGTTPGQFVKTRQTSH